jgi:hypothetical protein
MNQMIEYMKIHLISLQQDYAELSGDDRESIINLFGQIKATEHLLSVAEDMIK